MTVLTTSAPLAWLSSSGACYKAVRGRGGASCVREIYRNLHFLTENAAKRLSGLATLAKPSRMLLISALIL